MPLPPLPASNTKRYWLIVTGPSSQHRIQVRVADSVSDAAAVAGIRSDFAQLGTALAGNYTLDGLEVAVKGSDIRNPVSGFAQVIGPGLAISGQDLARTFSIRARSTTGRKVKWLLWGITVAEQPDFQLGAADLGPGLSGLLGAMIARSDMYLAIDGTKPIFKPDMLEDYNDHWEKEMRP